MKEGTIIIKNKKPSTLPSIHIGHAISKFFAKIHNEYIKAIDSLAIKTARMLDRSSLAV